MSINVNNKLEYDLEVFNIPVKIIFYDDMSKNGCLGAYSGVLRTIVIFTRCAGFGEELGKIEECPRALNSVIYNTVLHEMSHHVDYQVYGYNLYSEDCEKIPNFMTLAGEHIIDQAKEITARYLADYENLIKNN